MYLFYVEDPAALLELPCSILADDAKVPGALNREEPARDGLVLGWAEEWDIPPNESKGHLPTSAGEIPTIVGENERFSICDILRTKDLGISRIAD